MCVSCGQRTLTDVVKGSEMNVERGLAGGIVRKRHRCWCPVPTSGTSKSLGNYGLMKVCCSLILHRE